MTPSLFGDWSQDRSAVLSPCGLYRYTLRRASHVRGGDGVVNFIMLNPSTADATTDDPTIRRCVAYARSWCHAELVVTNLFALRSTDPGVLKLATDPIGPDNDRHLIEQARNAKLVICAWGSHGTLNDRADAVVRMLRGEGIRLYCLRTNGVSGQPAHPLYLPASLAPIPFVSVAAGVTVSDDDGEVD